MMVCRFAIQQQQQQQPQPQQQHLQQDLVFSVRLQFRRPSSSEALVSSSKCRLTLKDATIEVLKIVFHQSLSSIEGYVPPKVVFHQRMSFIKSHLP